MYKMIISFVLAFPSQICYCGRRSSLSESCLVVQLTTRIESHWDVCVLQHAVQMSFGTLPCTNMHAMMFEGAVGIVCLSRHVHRVENHSGCWCCAVLL